jgi:hypothetical protein
MQKSNKSDSKLNFVEFCLFVCFKFEFELWVGGQKTTQMRNSAEKKYNYATTKL